MVPSIFVMWCVIHDGILLLLILLSYHVRINVILEGPIMDHFVQYVSE